MMNASSKAENTTDREKEQTDEGTALEFARMSTINDLTRRTKICRRVLKELLTYEKEVETETAKTAKMHEAGVDSHDIKQQENVLAESKMMVPECRKLLKDHLGKLQGYFAAAAEENPPNEQGDELPEIKDARKLITDLEEKLL